jgi:hypothetical protein
MLLDKSLLNRVQFAPLGETLDRAYFLAIDLNRQGQATANRLAVHKDIADSTHPVLTAHVGRRESQLFAQVISQVHARIDH